MARGVWEHTSEDYYATEYRKGAQPEVSNHPNVMNCNANIISTLQGYLYSILCGAHMVIGSLLELSQINDGSTDAAAFQARANETHEKFKAILSCLMPSNDNSETYVRSYDLALGRQPHNHVERLLRDTMIYVHRLAYELLAVLKSSDGDDLNRRLTEI